MAEEAPNREKVVAVALVNGFIERSFRDVADQDYIAARTVHRHAGLDLQFLWLAEQAVEKYLKAILLYNRRSAKRVGHNLRKAYAEILKIQDIPFDFPDDVQEFINYLGDYGPNRYFEHSYSLSGEECMQLDRTVWFIRRYCHNMRWLCTKSDGTREDMLAREIQWLQHPCTLDEPHKHKLFGGFLEKVLDDKRSPLRRQLVWKNFYYGSYKKQRIRYALHRTSANSALALHPAIYYELEKLVSFSQSVEDQFSSSAQPSHDDRPTP